MASKSFLTSLIKGQILRAVVEEATSANTALCNFQGDLLLVANQTGKLMKKGEPIFLQVKSLHPLQFEIFDGNNKKFERVV